MPRPGSDSIWVIGVAMTPFRRYADADACDPGGRSALSALADAGLTIADADVLAAGSVNQARPYPAQQIQRRIGQTGIPAFNVLNACATGATAVRVAYLAIAAGEASIGLAVGCEQMGKKGLLGQAAPVTGDKYVAAGKYGAVMSIEGVLGTGLMP